ncbi:guanyl-nucleotide exchange factor [Aureococcus anophagefferens]|uniref:Guanyl-nucleotide exchange factor n=1 Tax=Aureococcus anophagefferens TaxID=44056 RepID=A0ABR1FJH4_AURAN
MDRSLFHSPKTLLDRLRNRSPPTVDDPAHAHHLVYACGYNATGQLGCGDRESRVVPWRVRTSRLGKGRVDGVACGSSYSVVVVAGQVASCGKNVHGQLGHGGRDEETAPRVVEGLRGVRVVAVAARGAHTLALDDRGRVYSWGRGDEGQLGHGAFEAVPHPRRIARLPTSVVAVGAGRTHSLALDADGAVYSWGCGDDGALGHGDRRRQLAPRAVEFFRTRPASALSCGSRHNAVVTADGALVTWGWAAYGQCGASAGGDGLRPAEVPLPGDGGAECVLAACGYRHTLCATRHASGDAIWAFGWNAYGQCGGSTCSAAAPRRVGGKFLGSPDGNNGAVVEALSAAVPNSNLQVDFSALVGLTMGDGGVSSGEAALFVAAGRVFCCYGAQVFVGQPAFKQMGARHGYMLGSGFVALVVGCSPRLMVWVTAAFPLAAGAGFLFWIGLAVTASAFSPASSGLHSSHFASAAATAMGLVPVIAAWGTQLVSSTTAAAGADARRVFGDLQRAGVDASGLAALAQGSLLSSVSLAATLASVLDRHFGAAALWSLLNAALAGLGFIHAYRIDHAAVVADVGGLVFLRNSKALQAAVGYLLAAAILLWFSVREDIELRPDALRRRLLRVRDFCLPRRRRHRGAGDERSPLVAQLPKPSAQFLPIHAAPEPARAQSRDAAASF